MPHQGYSRISTYLRGFFRTLSGPDDHPLAQLNTLGSGPSREEFMAASPLPETVNHFLFQMDVKLDAILSSMQSSGMEQDFPHRMEIIAISASDLVFTTDMPLAPGDLLEVIITFQQPSVYTASGIGKVVKRNVDHSGKPLFAFAFTRLHEEEREKIIRYVFKEERRQLRESRLE